MSTNIFNKEYFIIKRPDDDRLPIPSPDADTAENLYKVQPLGAKPLIFREGYPEDETIYNNLPDIIVGGGNILVINEIAEKLRDMDIPNLAVQPAIFIDRKKKWHENYWYLTFTKDFDCWDREHSDYDPEPIDTEPPSYDVYRYSLNEELLKKTPLKDRLLFSMGATITVDIFVHESIADLFRVFGVDLVPVEDYGVNYP
jgi:hypothetical protein